jgi:hypothetical protein
MGNGTSSSRAEVEIDDPERELSPSLYAVAKVQIPVNRIGLAKRALMEDWRDQLFLEGVACSASIGSGLSADRGLAPLLKSACQYALSGRGWVLAVPETAVLDTGEGQLIYLESSPGMFEANAVTLGPRCGDFYPLFRGPHAGQLVAATGAFLIDAETRLNPGLAASYFGATRGSGEHERLHKTQAPISEEEAIARQKKCPVSDEDLGSMGPPVRVVVDGRIVFLCCSGCKSTLESEPGKYLAKLPQP